jgi:hypothetical protein
MWEIMTHALVTQASCDDRYFTWRASLDDTCKQVRTRQRGQKSDLTLGRDMSVSKRATLVDRTLASVAASHTRKLPSLPTVAM